MPLTPWQFLWNIIKPYKWWYVLMLQAPLLTAFYIFANNYSLKLLIDAFSGSNLANSASLLFPVVLFISAQLGVDFFWRIRDIAEWKVEPLVRQNLLLSAYNIVQYHPYTYFQNTQSGIIISKLKGLLDGYDAISVSIHRTLGQHLCVVIVSVFALLIINDAVFIFMLLWCLIVALIILPMGFKLNEFSNKTAESRHRIISLFADNITNIFSLFYFSKRQYELKRAKQSITQDYMPAQMKLYHYNFKFSLIGSALYCLMLISLFLLMIYLRKNNEISTGDFLFVMLTAITISFDLWELMASLCNFMKILGEFKSCFTILSVLQSDMDNPDAKPITERAKGSIEFRNLSFAYEQNVLVLSHLNLRIKAGDKIGIVGHSGAGKSTLISLLLKNFKPTTGSILLDGRPIDEITTDSLRQQIALIPQDIMLFYRSIGENIGYSKIDASLDEIKKAAKMANLDEYIESLPEKYDTLVGERGIKLSSGQRQRIAIARAILKNAPIIILDEATSSLDTLTEQQIQTSINRMLEKNPATIIAIAHRLSTIRHMDKIVVIEGGNMIEVGSFDELMAHGGYFKTLWDSQINGMLV